MLEVHRLGVRVRLRIGFVGVLLLLGCIFHEGDVVRGLIWGALALGIVSVSELGQAIALRHLGFAPVVDLSARLGRVHWSGEPTRAQRVVIALAGPVFGAALSGVLVVITTVLPTATLELALQLSLGWVVLQLLPMLPWSGSTLVGAIADRLTNGAGAKPTAAISAMVGLGLLLLAFEYRMYWATYFALIALDTSRERWSNAGSALPPAEVRPHVAVSCLLRSEHKPAYAASARRNEAHAKATTKPVLQAYRFEDAAWWYLLAADVGNARRIAKSIEPSPTFLAMLAIESGDAQQALNILDGEEPEDDDPSHEYWAQIIAAALIDLGKLTDAEHFIQSYELRCATYHVLTTRAFYADQWDLAASLAMESFERFEDATAAYNAACSHARAGRITDGMAWLKWAVASGFAKLEQLDTDSDIDALRQHPDFEALRDRIA